MSAAAIPAGVAFRRRHGLDGAHHFVEIGHEPLRVSGQLADRPALRPPPDAPSSSGMSHDDPVPAETYRVGSALTSGPGANVTQVLARARAEPTGRAVRREQGERGDQSWASP